MKLFGVADGAGAMMMKGNVYINTYGEGLQKLQEQQSGRLPRVVGRWPSQYLAGAVKAGEKYLIFMESGEVYRARGGNIEPYDTDLPTGTQVLAVNRLSTGEIVVASFNRGTFVLDENGELVMAINAENNFPYNENYALGVDNDDNIWLGHPDGIVHVKYGLPMKLVDLPGLNGQVQAVYETEDGTLYVGTSVGAFQTDYTGAYRRLGAVTAAVWGFGEYDGEVWAATSNGLVNLSGGANTLLRNEVVLTLHESEHNDGYLYVGTTNGLFVVRDGDATPLPELNVSVNSIVEEKDGTLWIGTNYQGLARAKQTGGQYRVVRLGKKEGLSDTYVRAFMLKGTLYFNANNAIYTSAGGNRFKRDEKLSQRVGSEKVYAYANQYLATSKGVAKYDGETLNYTYPINYVYGPLDLASTLHFPASGKMIRGIGEKVYIAKGKVATAEPKAYLRNITIGEDSTYYDGYYWKA